VVEAVMTVSRESSDPSFLLLLRGCHLRPSTQSLTVAWRTTCDCRKLDQCNRASIDGVIDAGFSQYRSRKVATLQLLKIWAFKIQPKTIFPFVISASRPITVRAA
jgi:hypothetical protein